MVAREGYAPSFAGCRPAVLLLNYRARRNWRSTGDLHPGRLVQARLFSGQLPRLAGRAPSEMAPPRGVAPRSHVLTGRQHTPCFRGNDIGAPGRIFACVVPFRRRVPDTLGHGSIKFGRAPRCCPGRLLVPNEAGSLAPSRADIEIGGLCGLCSRDLSLDKRALFVAELTGREMVRLYRPARVFSDLPPHEIGRGTWSRTTMEELMRLPRFSTFPQLKLVDRRGFAPRSPACGAGDLLNDRAAQIEKMVAEAGIEPTR